MRLLDPIIHILTSFLGTAQKPMPIPPYLQGVDVAFWKSNAYRAEKGDLEEISTEQIRVASHWDVGRGAKLELNIDLPSVFPSSIHALRVHAKVLKCQKPVRRKRYRITCEFVDLDPTARKIIQEFLDWGSKAG